MSTEDLLFADTRVNPPTCQGKPEIFGRESSDLFDYQNDSDVLEAGGKRLTVNKKTI